MGWQGSEVPLCGGSGGARGRVTLMLLKLALNPLLQRQLWMVTLQQLHRMGSFTSKPQMESEEGEDDLVSVPDGVLDRQALLRWVQAPLAHLPPLLPRVYRPRPTHVSAAKSTASSPATTPTVKSPVTTPTMKSPVTTPTAKSSDTQAHIPLPGSFRVMQWNILAQALGTHADNFVKCPPAALEWKTRRYRILEEIITHQPHIICLQEVDHYRVLERVLDAQGYQGLFMPKPDSPCLYLPSNSGPDGCAVFWDNNRFKLLAKETRVVEVWHVQSNQVAILLVLEERTTGKQLVVLTTHLKARQGALLSSLRNEQGKDLLSFLNEHRQVRPTIVCGDFNAEPSEPVYTTMIDGTTGLESAYALLNGGKEPQYSTWKVRGDQDCCHNIDYIFYTPVSLHVEGGLDVPTEKAMGPGRVPNLSYPSDHFSLVCDFTFLADKDTRNDTSSLEIGSNISPVVYQTHARS
ncbi:nocturnin isoform X2 [Procambarus clarkii]|uniref:nocturnin isoform X2 n=1 Tax=Procambarus clarkii TaxID=6728 RepID=UPI0037438764